MGAPTIRQRFEHAQQHLPHAIEVLHHIGVRNPHNIKSERFQPRCSPHIRLRIGLSVTIDLNDQTFLGTEKIRNRTAYHHLAAELEAAKL